MRFFLATYMMANMKNTELFDRDVICCLMHNKINIFIRFHGLMYKSRGSCAAGEREEKYREDN